MYAISTGVLATCMLLLTSCGGLEDKQENGSGPDPEIPFLDVDCPRQGDLSHFDEKSQRIINDQTEFEEYYSLAIRGSNNSIPPVDFENLTVIGLTLDEVTSSGYLVDVDSITENSASISVNYTITTPANDCASGLDAGTPSPYCFVAIEKTSLPITFNPREIKACDTSF